ncbi:MAG: L-histidine N(alpha)-methyltransferase [Pseudomonadota bacterium]
MDDLFDPVAAAQLATFRADVVRGLSKEQKTLPCQYFYDEAGSVLFEQITELSEYYPTRTEVAILNAHIGEISETLGKDILLVEYGAGASTKTRILLDNLVNPAGYVPIDVSEDFLLQTAEGLRRDYPALPVHPIVGDFMIRLGLPTQATGQPVGFFPGSTIGNLDDDSIDAFMRAARALLGETGKFLIGVDLRKSPDILVPAYDDAAGVTAAFNLNLLNRINRELDANFDLDAFVHRAIWNDDKSRIEMHLESQIEQDVTIAEDRFSFARGETIHTENSRKFDLESLKQQISHTGWHTSRIWHDARSYFAVILLNAV